MENSNRTAVTVQATVNKPIQDVWAFWNEPEHITQWCQASDDWHAPFAENDLQTGGRFKTTMAAKDGSYSFDFSGAYTEVQPMEKIAYRLDDDRFVSIIFKANGDETTVEETFETESSNPVDMQRAGWQAIMDNFKKYAESK
jgi:uncharacterized protein YndB with AHSA1/START domain